MPPRKTEQPADLIETLERVFHSPGRMAIMSALCAADRSGMTFTELKLACRLTDGNLNGHLGTLTDAGVVKIRKEFVNEKPRTTVLLTKAGVERFSDYLDALQLALKNAKAALPAPAAKPAAAATARAARA